MSINRIVSVPVRKACSVRYIEEKTIRQIIASEYDPTGTLNRDSDPHQLLATIRKQNDRNGIVLSDCREYLASLDKLPR